MTRTLGWNLSIHHVCITRNIRYYPAQKVFGQDSILNTCHKANWQLIKIQNRNLINKGDEQDYRNKKEHMYN